MPVQRFTNWATQLRVGNCLVSVTCSCTRFFHLLSYFTGTGVPNKLTSSQLRGFIAQLVGALHRRCRGDMFKYCKASQRDIVHPTYLQPPARTCIASSLDFWHSCFQCFQSTFAHPKQFLRLWTIRLAQWCKSCSLFVLAILEKSVTPSCSCKT